MLRRLLVTGASGGIGRAIRPRLASLAEEVFGSLGLLVRAAAEDQMIAVAEAMVGQLTTTLQLDAGDHGLARRLTPVLERKAGRLLANGFPTGVEVADAMLRGGPIRPPSTSAPPPWARSPSAAGCAPSASRIGPRNSCPRA